MHDNLIITRIPQRNQDNPEKEIREFMQTSFKLSKDTVKNITFHRGHCNGTKNSNKPRPIAAKFEHYMQKELVKSRGKELKGTHFGINDQYPWEIQDRRKRLPPVLKEY